MRNGEDESAIVLKMSLKTLEILSTLCTRGADQAGSLAQSVAIAIKEAEQSARESKVRTLTFALYKTTEIRSIVTWEDNPT